ncbi:MAG: hypothetical protein ACRDYC_03975, partial [Acidimicrobiales bacterium]
QLAGQAAFGADPPEAQALRSAGEAAPRLQAALVSDASMAARLRRLVDPFLAWRPPSAAPRSSGLVGAAPPPAADVVA